jgi:hypothetical protein
MNCFELSTILAGKWVGEMFQNKKENENHEYINYFFTCNLTAENLADLLKEFFEKNAKDVVYIEQESGKYNIQLKYSTIENILLTVKVYKITVEKYILSIVYNEGNKTTFFKMMRDFIQDYDKSINII